MRGVVFTGGREIELMEFPDPTPGPGEVVVEMKASGMCGSDLHQYRRPRAQARNATRHARIEEERVHLRALPVRPLPAYRESYATVSRSSAVRILKHSYSVSSRLIGYRLRVRLHADIVEHRLGPYFSHLVLLISVHRSRFPSSTYAPEENSGYPPPPRESLESSG